MGTDPERDDFDSSRLNINFQSLRIPLGEDMLSLTERPGYLRLKGAETLSSRFRQSLIARRQQAFRYTAFAYPLDRDVSIEGWKRCYLKAEVNYDKLRFFYSKDGSADIY